MDSSAAYSVDGDMCRSESPFLTSECTVPLRGWISVSGFMAEVETEEEMVDRDGGLSASRIRFEDADGGGIGKGKRLSSCCESASNSAT